MTAAQEVRRGFALKLERAIAVAAARCFEIGGGRWSPVPGVPECDRELLPELE
jgi:hypothetical protein